PRPKSPRIWRPSTMTRTSRQTTRTRGSPAEGQGCRPQDEAAVGRPSPGRPPGPTLPGPPERAFDGHMHPSSGDDSERGVGAAEPSLLEARGPCVQEEAAPLCRID